jgi:arylsulfatase A-like enzyme
MNIILILCDTLRRDHCGAYSRGRPLNACWSDEQPDWHVPTPNMDRLAERGCVFDNCYHGSTPCMPARRDIYTGRYEFLERGWGPLEDDDADLPRQVSGPPNMSVQWTVREGYRVSYLVSDHFHLWEQGSGNYHMGYTGFEFIRGFEADAWRTDPVEFPCPQADRFGKNERHWRNVHLDRRGEEDWFCARTFRAAADWLRRNAGHDSFYLHVDSFTPHEPFDAPEAYVRMFDPAGRDASLAASAPYAPWRERLTEAQFRNYRARYAGRVAFLDRQIGVLLDALDDLGLWDETVVILTTDHGTFNGDHGRTGKLQTHEFDCKAHVPMIVAHPQLARGERRGQLVQLVDLYPTVLEAVGRPLPELPAGRGLHGRSLIPLLAEADAPGRDYAVMGQFGKSVSITDGRWVLHQSPPDPEDNRPLYWYGHHLARFITYDLGPYVEGRREAATASWPTETYLSDKDADPNELVNLAGGRVEKLREMQAALKRTLLELAAPAEQIERLGLSGA